MIGWLIDWCKGLTLWISCQSGRGRGHGRNRARHRCHRRQFDCTKKEYKVRKYRHFVLILTAYPWWWWRWALLSVDKINFFHLLSSAFSFCKRFSVSVSFSLLIEKRKQSVYGSGVLPLTCQDRFFSFWCSLWLIEHCFWGRLTFSSNQRPGSGHFSISATLLPTPWAGPAKPQRPLKKWLR